MARKVDMTGSRHGRLVVLGPAETRKGKATWRCACDCGAETTASGNDIRSGNTKSCGCLKASRGGSSRKNYPREYSCWCAMRTRCNYPKNNNYAFYGGRGISVCPAWDGSFAEFLRDMGPMPSPNHSVDRIDANGNYEPGNCRWATRDEQGLNTRKTVRVTVGGITRSIRGWGVALGSESVVDNELRRNGGTPESAVVRVMERRGAQ